MNRVLWPVFTILLAACNDDNSKPLYAKDTGLPVNCRAYVQLVIDEYRSGKYSADESFNGLERNCGVNGYSWKNTR